ncbi:MAG: M48 family metallopeptidase [Phycisphaerales bacterium]|nr:M48 family metallopeptidase [Phycisphaerales bacterium]
MPDATVDAMGQEAFESIRSEGDLVEHGDQFDKVRSVSRHVIDAAIRRHPGMGLEDHDWEVVLIEDDTANAFALPGGRIGVHTGLLRVTGTDDALAIVLGHEVAHVLARHASERLSQHLLIVGGTALGAALLDFDDEEDRELAMAALGVGAQIGVTLPYSRLHESEADELGLFIAAEAGYDPGEAIGLWRRMGEDAPSDSFEFLSTHPHSDTRIEQLKVLIPQARAIRRGAPVQR